MIPCSYWALTCCAALPSCKTLYVISVRQTRDLPVVSLFPHPASFRFHLTMDTLAFGYILPTTRRIRDLHPLETCAAGRTQKKDLKKAELFVKSRLLQILFIIIHYPTERHSLPSSTPPNPAPCQNIHAHHNAEQRRGQEGKSARRADGLRNSECFPFSQITAFQKAEPLSPK
jgi:hypothetical protein